MGVKTFAHSQFQQAQDFVNSAARPIEQALFAWRFANGDPAQVVAALAPYQNEDGGFGHGLEPDFWVDASSPLATMVAFQTLTQLPAAISVEMAQKGLAYFVESYHPNERRWYAVPPQVNDFPHAPWWHYDAGTGGCAIDATPANPSFEIIGYLHRCQAWLPKAFHPQLNHLLDDAVGAILERPEEVGEHHALLCALRLAETIKDARKTALTEQLTASSEKRSAMTPPPGTITLPCRQPLSKRPTPLIMLS